MRKNRLAVLGLTVLALTVPVGCGGSDDKPSAGGQPAPGPATSAEAVTEEPTPSGPAALPDACSLVRKPEAEKLAGTGLDDAQAVQDTCTYTAPVTGPTGQVEVYVGDGAKKYLDIERDLGHEVRPLSGVGDEAYATLEGFFINKGGVWVAVRLVRLNDPAENRQALEALARTVGTRM
ncbi:hypothetical protein [Micromonospora narathiwatensis]|uniref:DUF3558 domain-containing protein n=1 Tax=Micromonospora narathiwatensis TaxID=299146 RepID=A0A1A9A6Z6_9ACTN|nr:hypothetical protein [Micromonospora narathiwatensis]SBT51888.1 hypothetical protein GA0070621_4228 [Micromonospora narathiwatensis]